MANYASSQLDPQIKSLLQGGLAIPAHPLALTAHRKLDERRQRALSRYYIDAEVGGLAVGVHTTQFEIRDPNIGLFKPVLELASEEMDRSDSTHDLPLVRIGGICGSTKQAVVEAELLKNLGYHMGLLSLAGLRNTDEKQLIDHCVAVGRIIPLAGFYLQTAVGGRRLPYSFWRRLCELEAIVAIKIAPFNRYQTADVVRAVVDAGRDDIALYTGNDDSIIMDLLTPYSFLRDGIRLERRIVGGLLGHWSVWTKTAVDLFRVCKELVQKNESIPQEMLRLANEITDANAAFFDAANQFGGVIAGLHEVLRRQGLLEGIWCLNTNETLGSGQRDEIDRVYAAYPHLNDDAFVAEHRDCWLSG